MKVKGKYRNQRNKRILIYSTDLGNATTDYIWDNGIPLFFFQR